MTEFEELREMIAEQDESVHGGEVDRTAREWEKTGWDVQTIIRWIQSGTWDIDTARMMSLAGITPEQVSTWTDEKIGMGEYPQTIGYKASNADLTIGEVLQIIGEDLTPELMDKIVLALQREYGLTLHEAEIYFMRAFRDTRPVDIGQQLGLSPQAVNDAWSKARAKIALG